jgi:hypothetical protein
VTGKPSLPGPYTAAQAFRESQEAQPSQPQQQPSTPQPQAAPQ